MAGLDPAIHATELPPAQTVVCIDPAWMPGARPGMTGEDATAMRDQQIGAFDPEKRRKLNYPSSTPQ